MEQVAGDSRVIAGYQCTGNTQLSNITHLEGSRRIVKYNNSTDEI